MAEPLTLVHAGSFSGSAESLRDALREQVVIRAVDTMPMVRRPELLLPRVRGMVEARRYGCPWTKTAAWSTGLQRFLENRGVLTAPLLVVQSIAGFELPGVRYGVYTDRVGREGARVGGVHASRFSPRWLARETSFLRGAHRVFVMGPSTRTVLVEEYGCEPDRVEVVGAGPNTELGPPTSRTRARRLLFVGTQWELKGGPSLLDAFASLRVSRPELELLLVGSGPEGSLPPGVVAAGRVGHAEMDAVYDSADVLVIPTHMEAFGIALVEGLMKGLPCVCSTVGNQPWIIGDAGEAVPPGDVNELVAALTRVIDGFPDVHRRALSRGAELRSTMAWPRVAQHIVDGMAAL